MVAGFAIGGGHVLHLVCDLTIAADNAQFGQSGPRVGSFDAGFGAGLLARTIGTKRAKEIWFLCRRYDAARALEMGLVNAVVPLDRLEAGDGGLVPGDAAVLAARPAHAESRFQRRRGRSRRRPAARRGHDDALLHDRGSAGGPERLRRAPAARTSVASPAGLEGPGILRGSDAAAWRGRASGSPRPDRGRFPPSIVPVAVGVAVARSTGHVVAWHAILALVVSLAMQIGANFANDYSDGVRGTDARRVGPTRLVASGLASPAAVRAAALATFAVGATAGLVLAVVGVAVVARASGRRRSRPPGCTPGAPGRTATPGTGSCSSSCSSASSRSSGRRTSSSGELPATAYARGGSRRAARGRALGREQPPRHRRRMPSPANGRSSCASASDGHGCSTSASSSSRSPRRPTSPRGGTSPCSACSPRRLPRDRCGGSGPAPPVRVSSPVLAHDGSHADRLRPRARDRHRAVTGAGAACGGRATGAGRFEPGLEELGEAAWRLERRRVPDAGDTAKVAFAPIGRRQAAPERRVGAVEAPRDDEDGHRERPQASPVEALGPGAEGAQRPGEADGRVLAAGVDVGRSLVEVGEERCLQPLGEEVVDRQAAPGRSPPGGWRGRRRRDDAPPVRRRRRSPGARRRARGAAPARGRRRRRGGRRGPPSSSRRRSRRPPPRRRGARRRRGPAPRRRRTARDREGRPGRPRGGRESAVAIGRQERPVWVKPWTRTMRAPDTGALHGEGARLVALGVASRAGASAVTLQASFAATLVDEWARAGVTDAVIAPGSRSSPLAVGLFGDDRIRVHVRLDERSAGFFAVGLALASARPVVVVVTSGTAAAELHPAVVEADLAGVPLVVCTADRPPELATSAPRRRSTSSTSTGAPSASSPIRGCPTRRPAALALVREPARRRGDAAAPGDRVPCTPTCRSASRSAARPDDLPPGRRRGPSLARRRRRRRRARGGRRAAPRRESAPPGAASSSPAGGRPRATRRVPRRSAAAAGWPVLADSLAFPRLPGSGVVAAWDAIVRSRAALGPLRPEVVLRVGAPPASRALASWQAALTAAGASHVLVDPSRTFRRPRPCRRGRVAAASRGRCAAAPPTPLAGSGGAPAGGSTPGTAAEAAAQARHRRGARRERRAHRTGGRASPRRRRARPLERSSSPRRCRSATSTPTPRPRDGRTDGVREPGANGIDGVVSTVLGVAASGVSAGSPAARAARFGLLGDLAFFHDLSALVRGAHEERRRRDDRRRRQRRRRDLLVPARMRPELERALFERAFATPQSPGPRPRSPRRSVAGCTGRRRRPSSRRLSARRAPRRGVQRRRRPHGARRRTSRSTPPSRAAVVAAVDRAPRVAASWRSAARRWRRSARRPSRSRRCARSARRACRGRRRAARRSSPRAPCRCGPVTGRSRRSPPGGAAPWRWRRCGTGACRR